MYNAMNITPRPYASQGYRAEQESDEQQTQDSLSQKQGGRGQNRDQNNGKTEPKTIARGRAPLTAHGNRAPKKVPMSARPGNPVKVGAPNRPPMGPKAVTNHSVPKMSPVMPQNLQANQQVAQQPVPPRQPLPKPVIQQPIQPQLQAPQVDAEAQEKINNMAKNNRVNIAQVIKDFRGTYAAIGTPQCLVDEVEDYLAQVIEHTKGEAPSINFVQTNLQNAAVIIDKYISETLDKDSKVVQNWLDALFLQRINYKFNDSEVNEDFLVKFPEGGNAPQQPDNVEERASVNSIAQMSNVEQPGVIPDYEPIPDYQPNQPVNQTNPIKPIPVHQEPVEIPEIEDSRVIPQPQRVVKRPPRAVRPKTKPVPVQRKKPQITIIPEDNELKALFVQAKKQAYSNNPAKAMNIFKKALVRASEINDCDAQSRINFEMGKIYDNNNYLAQALNSYNLSLHDTTDNSIKVKAHYSMAKIYDDVNQIHSAIDHYMTSVSYAGQEDNLSSQSKSLTNIANIYTDRYNEDAFIFYDEANVLVEQTDDSKMKGYVSSNTAGAFNKFNKPGNALKCYANAVKNYAEAKENNSVAENYRAAGELMYDLKNPAKAKILLKKALAHTNAYRDAELINKINDLLEEIG